MRFPGDIYVAKILDIPGWYKMGRSQNASKRIPQLETYLAERLEHKKITVEPVFFHTVENYQDVERVLKDCFASRRAETKRTREVFEFTPKDLKLIEDFLKNGDHSWEALYEMDKRLPQYIPPPPIYFPQIEAGAVIENNKIKVIIDGVRVHVSNSFCSNIYVDYRCLNKQSSEVAYITDESIDKLKKLAREHGIVPIIDPEIERARWQKNLSPCNDQ